MKNTLLAGNVAEATRCLNLRPAGDGSNNLMPMMPPAIMVTGGWRVVGIYHEYDDKVVELLCRGSELGAWHHAMKERSGEPYIITDCLVGDVKATAIREGGGYMVYTDEEAYEIDVDESGMLRALVPVSSSDYPVPVISVMSETVMSAGVAGVNLAGTYDTRSTRLEARDLSKVSTALADAYYQGSNDCVNAGSLVAPVFSRYRLYDAAGHMLFESSPKLHVLTGRHDEGMTTTLNIDGSMTHVMGGVLTFPLYKLGVKMPQNDNTVAATRVARMDIQLTPQLHRVDKELTGTARLFSPALGELALSATAPAVSKESPVYRNMLLRTLRCSESLFVTVKSIENPFGASQAGKWIAIQPVNNTVDTEKSLLAKAREDEVTGWASRCRVPHHLTAGVASGDSDIKVLGDLMVRLYDGHTVSYYANYGTVTDEIETLAVVTFSDGRRVVAHEKTHGWRDMSLSPTLVYPDAEAVAIELTVRDSSGVRPTMRYPLSRCGRYAVYLGEDVMPITLPGEYSSSSFPAVNENNRQVRYPGKLLLFKGDRATTDARGVEVGSGEIKVIQRVDRSASSTWELTRSRYVVMGTDGIYSLSVNGTSPGAPVLLDSRPVMGEGSVAAITNVNDTSRVCAIADGDLVVIDVNRVKTLVRGIEATMLAWDTSHGELLAIGESNDGQSQAVVMHVDYDRWSMRSLPAISSVYNSRLSSRLMSCEDGGAIYDAAREVESSVYCRYECRVEGPARHHGYVGVTPALVRVDITGGSIDGCIRICGDNGRGPAYTFSRMWIAGEVAGEVVYRYLTRPRRRVYVEIAGMLSSDSRFGGIVGE